MKVCKTPYGMMKDDQKMGKRVLRIFGAGTTCVDWSSMGAREELFGQSCIPFACWLSEIKAVRPDI